jgi:hypothetical protein
MKNLVRAGLSLLAVALIPNVRAALNFNFIQGSGVTTDAYNGFVQAGNRWSSIFGDNVTINIKIDYSPLGAGIIGQSSSTEYIGDYSLYRSAMLADQTSAPDAVAIANLPGGTTLNGLMNVTAENGGSLTPYLDANGSHNNTYFISSSAQCKALNLVPTTTGIDAHITFSSNFNFDFDPSNGITSGYLDFVGVATHEIGHAMGFFSNVDDHDSKGALSEDAEGMELSLMDWFRFSSSGQRDWTVGNADKYFSINNGTTPIAAFATGINYGDGTQASHWKDNMGLGIMDPTANFGELLSISPNDIEMLDVLGWNRLDAQAVPEVGTVWASVAFLSLGAFEIRRRQSGRANFSAKI